MNTTDLIQSSFENGGGMLNTHGLYAVEGNANANTLKIVPLLDLQMVNLVCFINNQLHESLLMGVFNSQEAAEEYIVYLRTLVRDEKGSLIKTSKYGYQ